MFVEAPTFCDFPALPVVYILLWKISLFSWWHSVSLCLIGSWFSKMFRYRGNWRGDLPEGKGEYQVLWLWIFEYICTSVSVTFANISLKSWDFLIQDLNDSLMQVFSFSGRTGTSLWESLVPVFQVERVFMRQNLAISSLEGGSNSCCWLWLICWTVLCWRIIQLERTSTE